MWHGPGGMPVRRYAWSMPLSALVDGHLVCAPLLDEQQWSAVKGQSVLLQPCGHRGFGRVSPLGTQHFVHERDSGCEHNESPEHMHLKAVVARAASDSGWQAGTEVAGEGFVADVLASRDEQRIAFEVQRSKQVLRQYQQRQECYRQAGIRAVWLARGVPSGYICTPAVPLFIVSGWDGQPQAVAAGRQLPVPDLVDALLAGQVHWRAEVATTQRTSDIVRLLCPVCGTRRDVAVARWVQGRCVCGLPVAQQQADPRWWEQARCCGYWGPAVTLGRTSRSQTIETAVPMGHWCLQPLAAVEQVSA